MEEKTQERKNKLLVWIQKDYWYIVLCLVTLGVCGWTILNVDSYCSDITAAQCIGYCDVKQMEMLGELSSQTSIKEIILLLKESNNPICKNLQEITNACNLMVGGNPYGN